MVFALVFLKSHMTAPLDTLLLTPRPQDSGFKPTLSWAAYRVDCGRVCVLVNVA